MKYYYYDHQIPTILLSVANIVLIIVLRWHIITIY